MRQEPILCVVAYIFDLGDPSLLLVRQVNGCEPATHLGIEPEPFVANGRYIHWFEVLESGIHFYHSAVEFVSVKVSWKNRSSECKEFVKVRGLQDIVD